MIDKTGILEEFGNVIEVEIKCIDNQKLQYAFKKVKLLTSPKVKRVLGVLSGNQLNVTEIMIKLRDMDHAVISRVLSDLRKHNVVSYEVQGKSHYYKVNQFVVNQINKAVKRL